MNLPILGISMGDPFGNGPEITVKALADRSVYDRCRPLVVGDMASMEYAVKVAEKVSGIHLELRPVRSVAEARFQYGTIDVYDMGLIKAGDIPCDAADPRPFGLGATALGGEASFQYVVKVIELAMAGEVDATITNALSKEAINMAGHHYSGHTEIYADYTHTSKYTMMLAHEDLRVVHVSTHVSLREACDRVKKDRVLDVIRIANAGCKAIGIKEPKIAVAGLNPHCGENGMFGTEEIEEIQPAIDAAMAEGIRQGGESVVNTLLLPNAHPQLIPAISMTTQPPAGGAVGVLEFYSIASAITAADVAAKAANVTLIEVRIGYAIGGKGFVTLTGDVGAVREAVAAASRDAELLVGTSVIPRPAQQVFQSLL